MSSSSTENLPPPASTITNNSDAAVDDNKKVVVEVEGNCDKATMATTATSFDNPLFYKYELYGWNPNPSLSKDENFMDLVMLVTRTSQTTQGSMACILVQPSSTPSSSKSSFHDDKIISVATNGPFYSPNDSDIHAEIAALGDVCKRGLQAGQTTQNCTAYITMPPCKRCMAALTVSGITRIVSRLVPPRAILEAAAKHNIEIVALGKEYIKQQMERINVTIHGNPQGKQTKKTDDNNNQDSQQEKNSNEKKRRYQEDEANNNKGKKHEKC